jgi:hypothetical protein
MLAHIKTIILLVNICGCETSSLTSREEITPSVFENRVLRKLFGAKRVEVITGWRNRRIEELCHFYSSPRIIKIIKSWGWGGQGM